MSYTPIILCLLGFVGILLHNLIKLDSLNRAGKGKVNMGQYLSMERFTIFISTIVVTVGAFFLQHELSQFEQISKYLGFGFITLGYFAQSLVVKLMGRAQKYINTSDIRSLSEAEGFQQWEVTTLNQNVLSIAGKEVNKTLVELAAENPSYQLCNCGPGQAKFLYNTALLSEPVEIVFSTDGGKWGAIIPTGRRPSCA